MISRFDACLALTLREETGSAQPPGGPFVRRNLRTGQTYSCTVRPMRPDGFWFDDDPDDTGGRTAAGILQREFDAYCARCGKPQRDVWTITDEEVRTIYHEQYWRAIRGDDLPAGVDAFVFDSAVLQGVSAATRHLQEVLGVRIDGHMGTVTLDALQSSDSADVIARLAERRRRYLRGCKTFWKHGKGWLARVDRVEAAAKAAATVITRTLSTSRAAGAYHLAEEPVPVDLPADAGSPLSRKALAAPPGKPLSPAVLPTASGSYFSVEALSAIIADAATRGGLTIQSLTVSALSHPDILAQLLAGVALVAGGLWWWMGQRTTAQAVIT